MEKSQQTIKELKDEKLFSYNDLEKRFNCLRNRLVFSQLLQERFLEYFTNQMIHQYIQKHTSNGKA